MTNNTNTLLATLTIHNGLIIDCNEAFTEQFGFIFSQIKNTHIEDKLVLSNSASFSDINALFEASLETAEGVLTLARLYNHLHYDVTVKLHCVAQNDDVFKLYFSVSKNKSMDPISELPNGWALTSRIQYLLKNQHIALKNMVLIILDVDNFSTINYRYNYQIGDEYLIALAKVLQTVAENIGFVVRFANAKFGILIEDYELLPSEMLTSRIEQFCQLLCTELSKPIAISETLNITKCFSIGVSSPGIEYDCFHSMDIAAETEKQKAKKYSINKYYIATPEPTNELLTKKLIIDALPQAIAQHKIQVHYQPQYDINTKKLIGVEALSRWFDETLGHITPDVFIAITEEIGLHFEFDLWVFEKACKQIVAWQIVAWQKNAILVPRIAINISFKTMEMSTFIERIKIIVNKTGCPTNLLELEVTETSSITNSSMLSANMLQIKALGIYIAIDDFGTGYSSLSLIRNFHLSIDKLKLDRSLISKVCHTQLDRHFVKHIIELGKILNVAVLAEGVENQQQLDLLTELGCDYVQGYYFSKALPSEEIVQLICTTDCI
jgi:diguanylate cyclase (GGDEF)-like protein